MLTDVDLVEIKDGWLVTTPNSRRAAFGRTPDEAAAAWEEATKRFERSLERYRLKVQERYAASCHIPGEKERDEQ